MMGFLVNTSETKYSLTEKTERGRARIEGYELEVTDEIVYLGLGSLVT